MAVLALVPNRGTFVFIVREANGYRSREQGVVASGAGNLVAGTVMGKRTRGAAAAPVVTPLAGNTGNGTFTPAATPVDAAVTTGVYRVRMLTATTFAVYDPGGVEEGRGSTGVAYNGAINFTLAAGGTPFVVGDGFNIAVSYGAGSLEWDAYDPAATDGSEVAAGILCEATNATSAAVRATFVVRDCEVQRAELAFAGTPTTPQKDAAYAALAAAGIAFR